MIKVVGLGVKDGDLTIKGVAVIEWAEVVVVKTALTDTYKIFAEEQIKNYTCDHIYEKAENYDDLDKLIVDYILSFKEKKICYCVNGSGVDDRSVELLKAKTEIEIICGVSRESVCLQQSLNTAHVSMSAYDLIASEHFNYDTDYPFIIKDIDNSFVAGGVKMQLSKILGDECKVLFMTNEKVEEIELYEINHREDFNYSTSIIVPPLNLEKKLEYGYSDLIKILSRLRAKNGCEWDKAQTHESIRANAIEEAYELVEAINNNDIDNIIEESGDVILQGVFHAMIGDDEGEFEFKEVLTSLCKKLITRHTHIFGNVVANNKEEALKAWEDAKAVEKSHLGGVDKLKSLAEALPNVMKAEKMQKTAQKSGLYDVSIESVVVQINNDLKKYLETNSINGTMLFDVVNLMRLNGVESEVALGLANAKFLNCCEYVENVCKVKKIKTSEQEANELKKLWQEANENEDRKN